MPKSTVDDVRLFCLAKEDNRGWMLKPSKFRLENQTKILNPLSTTALNATDGARFQRSGCLLSDILYSKEMLFILLLP